MKNTFLQNGLLLLGFIAFFQLTACDPATDDPATKNETVTDASGNTYHTVKVGKLTILTENLKTTKFNDSTDIPLVTQNSEWMSTSAAYCHYDNDIQKELLYNYYALESGKLAPIGWHTVTNDEWDYVDSLGRAQFNNVYAKAMCSKIGWQTSELANAPGFAASSNNAWGLNVNPTGYRDSNGEFVGEGSLAYLWGGLWSFLPSFALTYNLEYNNTTMIQSGKFKYLGASVRCVKDY